MTIDPFTFVLEIVNFLVLVWLLHRFLYNPIQRAIAERRKTLNLEISAAEQREQKAQALQEQYEKSLAAWEQEKKRLQDELLQELNREETAALAKVRQAAEAERVRLQTLTEQELDIQRSQAQSMAEQNALHLTSKMLERVAGSELDQVLLQIMLEDLEQLPQSDRSLLRAAAARKQEPVEVITARVLTQDQQQLLTTNLSRLLESEIQCMFNHDPGLLSGCRLTIGDQVLHANLSDELAFFGRRLSLEEH